MINNLYKNLGPSRKFTARKMKVTIPWTGQRVEYFVLPALDPAMAVRVEEYEAAAHDALHTTQDTAAAESFTDISNVASATGTDSYYLFINITMSAE